MYLVFRCDCGRVLYTHEGNKTRKCSKCNKTLKVSNRRILAKSDNIDEVRLYIQKLQNEIYHNTGFIKASELKK